MEESYPYLISTKRLKTQFDNLQKISISCNEFTIGRDQENSVVIPYLPISRKHCKFNKTDQNEWTIEDNSSYGICINGIKLPKKATHKLSHNDTIRLDVYDAFEYKFIAYDEDQEPPKKMRKIDVSPEVIRKKFVESQSFEIEFMESKIQGTQKLQTISMERKKQLNMELERNVQLLKHEFAEQIESLKGEKQQIVMQKKFLEKQRDEQIASMEQDMDKKLNELKEEIRQHYIKEADLLRENSILKERLMKEREDFLLTLNKESSSKQDMLTELEAKVKKQEVMRIQEKQQLEETLHREMEQLKLAKEKEIKDLMEQRRLKEKEMEYTLEKMKHVLEQQIELTKQKQVEAEQQLHEKTEELKKAAESDKIRMDELNKAREEAEKNLAEAQMKAEKSVEDLQKKVNEKEIELKLIQYRAEQPTEVIHSLQQQLETGTGKDANVALKPSTHDPDVSHRPETTKESTLTEVGELMESELQCSVCGELLVKPVTLSCSHTFCRYCITRWRKKSNNCPNCRAVITSEVKNLVLESFIDKMVENLTEDIKKKREEMLKEREELDATLNRVPTRRPGPRRGRIIEEEESSDADGSARDFDGYDPGSDSGPGSSVLSEEESSFDSYSDGGFDVDYGFFEVFMGMMGGGSERGRTVAGVPGSYYGGYGRCFRCGARGHWAPGCPLGQV